MGESDKLSDEGGKIKGKRGWGVIRWSNGVVIGMEVRGAVMRKEGVYQGCSIM